MKNKGKSEMKNKKEKEIINTDLDIHEMTNAVRTGIPENYYSKCILSDESETVTLGKKKKLDGYYNSFSADVKINYVPLHEETDKKYSVSVKCTLTRRIKVISSLIIAALIAILALLVIFVKGNIWLRLIPLYITIAGVLFLMAQAKLSALRFCNKLKKVI